MTNYIAIIDWDNIIYHLITESKYGHIDSQIFRVICAEKEWDKLDYIESGYENAISFLNEWFNISREEAHEFFTLKEIEI